jgi:hypothetical protein
VVEGNDAPTRAVVIANPEPICTIREGRSRGANKTGALPRAGSAHYSTILRTSDESGANRLIDKRESPSLSAMENSTMSQLARVNVLLSADEAERLNSYCTRHGFKKSTLIARLVREHLDHEDGGKAKKRSPRTAGKVRAA